MMALASAWLSLWLRLAPTAPEKWPGVDEAVVERFAHAAGRSARPLLPLEGDLLLFAFLCAGLLGGFLLGYTARMLLVEPPAGGQSEGPHEG